MRPDERSAYEPSRPLTLSASRGPAADCNPLGSGADWNCYGIGKSAARECGAGSGAGSYCYNTGPGAFICSAGAGDRPL